MLNWFCFALECPFRIALVPYTRILHFFTNEASLYCKKGFLCFQKKVVWLLHTVFKLHNFSKTIHFFHTVFSWTIVQPVSDPPWIDLEEARYSTSFSFAIKNERTIGTTWLDLHSLLWGKMRVVCLPGSPSSCDCSWICSTNLDVLLAMATLNSQSWHRGERIMTQSALYTLFSGKFS